MPLKHLVMRGAAGRHGETVCFPRLELSGDQIQGIQAMQAPDKSPKKPLRTHQRDPAKTRDYAGSGSSPCVTTPKSSDWSKDDVHKYKVQDFDFQANLQLFDKKKVFSEIRAQDGTHPQDRLVSHNLSSQRKLGHDQSVLERGGYTEDDRVLLATDQLASHPPLPTLKTPAGDLKVPVVGALVVSQIEQNILFSGVLSNDQMVENAGRSLCDFLFDQEAGILSRAVLVLVTADRPGCFALSAARHLLNRGIRVAVVPPADLHLTPGFFAAALRQFQKFGGTVHPSSFVKEDFSLVISTLPQPTFPQGIPAPIYSLVECTYPVSWTIRFGLPSALPATGPCVLCDVGWPSSQVQETLGDDCDYSRTFGPRTYTAIRYK